MNPTRMQDAFMAESLERMAGITQQLETLNRDLSDHIKTGSKDGMNQAYAMIELRFNQLVADNERRLMQAGERTAASIGMQLQQDIQRLEQVADTLHHRAVRLMLVWGGLSLFGSVVAGGIGSLMVLWLLRGEW